MGAGALGLLLLALLGPASGFKEHEFKKCADAHFCARNRDKEASKEYAVDPLSVAHHPSGFNAKLKNFGSPERPVFDLSLKLYAGGTVRLKIKEANRYEVVDVLVPDLESKAAKWDKVKPIVDGLHLVAGNVECVVNFSPLRVATVVDGKPSMTFNANGKLLFEHYRTKPAEGAIEGEWEESFKSHKDTKPKGPAAIRFDLRFEGARHVYGIPEHATGHSLKATRGDGISSEPYRMYNLDVFEYLAESVFGLYGSIPFMLGHQAGLTAGMFWLNAAEMYIDVDRPTGMFTNTQWIAESGIVDVFLFAGPSPSKVLEQYAEVTGPTELPQMFALGYHQCRWNYKNEADVTLVDGGFDEHDIPYDVLWLDIEHTDGKRYMTWDTRHFPTPERMQGEIAGKGRKMVTIVDPHVKRDNNFPMHKEATALGYYVKNKDGGDFDGWCWPGSSSYLDVTDPKIRDWWAGKFTPAEYKGSTPNLYIWNDMNEPSVFNGPEVTMQKDNLHFGGVEHRDVHNVYGMYYHLATADGLRTRGPEPDRPFVLSRAFFAGTQRVGPIWTGDNAADWHHLKVSVPMLLSLGVTGLTFSGADVGGFFGNPDAELLTRWYQLGAFYPFFRGHAHLDTKRREPWLFGEPWTTHIRDAIKTRYQILPYMYTLMHDASVKGQPALRPLWFDFPEDAGTFGEEEMFMLGPALLVRPVVAAGSPLMTLRLPGTGRWFDLRTGKGLQAPYDQPIKAGMDGIPVYIRGGTVLTRRDRARRSSAAMADDPMTLVVALDVAGEAEGELYMDDGHSYSYRSGAFIRRRFTFSKGRLACTSAGAGGGDFATAVAVERVVLLGLEGGAWKASVEGTGAAVAVEAGHASLGPAAPGAAPQAMILRKPDLPVAADWAIQLVRA